MRSKLKYTNIPVVKAMRCDESDTVFDCDTADFPYWYKNMPTSHKMFNSLRFDRKIIGRDTIRGYESVVERTYPRDYMRADGISNHFTEEARMKCRFGSQASPEEVWCNQRDKVLSKAKKFKNMKPIVAEREALYTLTRECNIFNPAFGLFVLRKLAQKMSKKYRELRILDPSSGWGDRCIMACVLGAAVYHGYDPNKELQKGYSEIINAFQPKHTAPGDYRVLPIPFENVEIEEGSYDIALTSPPFFDLEKYNAEGGETAKNLPKYKDWLAVFYKPYIETAWRGLAVGGFLALYVSDIYGAPLGQDAKRIVGEFPDSSEMMKFGFRQRVSKKKPGRIRPMYLWQKI